MPFLARLAKALFESTKDIPIISDTKEIITSTEQVQEQKFFTRKNNLLEEFVGSAPRIENSNLSAKIEDRYKPTNPFALTLDGINTTDKAAQEMTEENRMAEEDQILYEDIEILENQVKPNIPVSSTLKLYEPVDGVYIEEEFEDHKAMPEEYITPEEEEAKEDIKK